MAKQTYRVVGNRVFDGHAPGSVFDADLGDEREQWAVQAGHLSVSQAQEKETVLPVTAAGEEAAENPLATPDIQDKP